MTQNNEREALIQLLNEMSEFCMMICNSDSDAKIKGVIESKAFYIGHHPFVLNPESISQNEQQEAVSTLYDLYSAMQARIDELQADKEVIFKLYRERVESKEVLEVQLAIAVEAIEKAKEMSWFQSPVIQMIDEVLNKIRMHNKSVEIKGE